MCLEEIDLKVAVVDVVKNSKYMSISNIYFSSYILLIMNGNIGHPRIGGASFRCNNCSKYKCLLPMTFKGNMTNNHYYHPGNRASWSKRMRPNGGNGYNGNARSANRPGITRLG